MAGFEAFFWAIAQQESGGSYTAVGPQTTYGHAYGKYQVLQGNIAPWTKKYFGRALTPQQFLASPQAQEAVARGVLKGYYNRYGARGAAAMWYSGQSDPNKTYGNPPVYKYVNSVMKRVGGYSGQSTLYAASTSGGSTVAKLDDRTMASMYGLSYDMIKSSPELKKLFRKAVNEGWSGTLFAAHLKNSKWWKTQSSTLRKYITQKYTDPATWKQSNSASAAKINALAIQIGLGRQISKGDYTKLLQEALYKSRALGWSEERIKDYLGARVTTHGGVMWGEAGEAFDKLHELAYLNGMSYKTWFATEARDIVSGKSTLETAEAKIRKEAAAKYSAFADQIKAGQNVMDLASPYIRSVASILELAETDIDLKNKYVSDAMTGAKAGANYPLWEFENKLREDPLWKKTNNAREGMMTTARAVLRDFGFAY
jgi:hypothetical protein